LMLGDKCQKVPPKIMAGIQVWPCLLNECSLLLMVSRGTGPVGGLFADLIGRDEDGIATLGADGSDIRPSSVFITVGIFYASSCVTLYNDGSTAWFIICDGLIFTATKFQTDRVVYLAGGLIKCLTYMVLRHVTFVFDDALEVYFILFLIFA
jgi:hypothetical protein